MISEKLKELRENTGMNKKDFAAYLGVKYTTYNNYEVGTREPASDFLILISKKMDVSIDYIMGLSDEKEKTHSYALKSSEFEHIKKFRDLDDHGKRIVDMVLEEEYTRSTAPKETATIYNMPFSYDLAASAGTGEYAMDIAHFKTVGLTEEPPRGADFLVRISGNSMEPKFYDDDKVFIKRMDSVNVGEIGLFYLDGDVYIKKQGVGELISLNPDYKPIPIYEFSSARCFGKVLGKCECEIVDL